MSILKLENVVKTYGDFTAVNDVSFEVSPGKIFGLLGPNGAGKTSLIRVITTITRADSGQVYFEGQPLNESHPEMIGYMPEERGLYKKMKVGEHLLYLAQLKGLSGSMARKEIDYWLEKFGIEDWWNKKVEELSKGMQQKIQFIATVVHKPKLLILDEPFSGLDPVNTNLIKDEIRELNKQGIGVIFSTHRMEQVEEICEEIVLINKGRNVLNGKVSDVKERFKEHVFEIGYEGLLPGGFVEHADIVSEKANQVAIKFKDDKESNSVLKYLIDNEVQIRSFREILPTLNEIFIKQVEEKMPEVVNS
ncbi:MAG: ATP-binding cassette domain-containing protein [Saprospiraceae bacterium]|nr:ATP-binding cassette domain-containing protein [Saprospiraceae bacterium]